MVIDVSAMFVAATPNKNAYVKKNQEESGMVNGLTEHNFPNPAWCAIKDSALIIRRQRRVGSN